MTSTTFFSGSSSSTAASRAPAAARARQDVQAPAARPVVATASPVYAWMTQAMLAGMSPRARRLLRADY